MKRKISIFLLFFLCVIFFILILFYEKNTYIAHTNDEISLDDKIAQMLVVGYTNVKTKRILVKDVQNNKISGIIFFKRNIPNSNVIKSDIKEFKLNAQTPIFLMLDQEGGRVSRINKDNGFKYFPSAKVVGEKYSIEQAYTLYFEMAKMLKDIGFNFNLAPCVDVDKVGSSIGNDYRIYSSDEKKIVKYASVFIRAHSDNKIICALKHYPGLGSASLDTHKGLPDITRTWNSRDEVPFVEILKINPKQPIVIGHVYNKNLDEENISSLSKKTIESLNTSGIVIMDAVDMTALKDLNIEDIIIKGINSGVNLFIFPNWKYSYYDKKVFMTSSYFHKVVNSAIENGLIDEKLIDISYKKIIELKTNL